MHALNALEQRITDDQPYRSNPPVHEGIASEPNVQVLFRDFVRPGDYVFDVGAHIGALTQALSRLVGPFGHVLSLEANPRTVPLLIANVSKNALSNVFVLNEAVWSSGGLPINVIESGAASAVSLDETGFAVTPTTTIDELCARFARDPVFMKIDIEGAEFEALVGAQELIARAQPALVLEHNRGDDRALEWLRDRSYLLIDVSDYREMTTSQSMKKGMQVTNVLAVPSKLRGLYQDVTLVVIGTTTSFERADTNRAIIFLNRYHLEPGRYVVEVSAEFRASSTVYTRVRYGSRVLSELCTSAEFFFRNHDRIVFQADLAGDYVFEVGEYLSDGETGALEARSAIISRIDFPQRPR